MIQTTNTERSFIRINYWDGDVLDRKLPANIAHSEARKASEDLKADVDVCVGATVLATYRNGEAL